MVSFQDFAFFSPTSLLFDRGGARSASWKSHASDSLLKSLQARPDPSLEASLNMSSKLGAFSLPLLEAAAGSPSLSKSSKVGAFSLPLLEAAAGSPSPVPSRNFLGDEPMARGPDSEKSQGSLGQSLPGDERASNIAADRLGYAASAELAYDCGTDTHS